MGVGNDVPVTREAFIRCHRCAPYIQGDKLKVFHVITVARSIIEMYKLHQGHSSFSKPGNFVFKLSKLVVHFLETESTIQCHVICLIYTIQSDFGNDQSTINHDLIEDYDRKITSEERKSDSLVGHP